MKREFTGIQIMQEVGLALKVIWHTGEEAIYTDPGKAIFMDEYRVWLSRQEDPADRICYLDGLDENGIWSYEIEMESMRAMMNSEEREKFDRTESNIFGVTGVLEAFTKMQERTDAYSKEILEFQKNAIIALKNSEGFLMKGNVSRWELKRIESLIFYTTRCRDNAKKINAVMLQVLEDWL